MCTHIFSAVICQTYPSFSVLLTQGIYEEERFCWDCSSACAFAFGGSQTKCSTFQSVSVVICYMKSYKVQVSWNPVPKFTSVCALQLCPFLLPLLCNYVTCVQTAAVCVFMTSRVVLVIHSFCFTHEILHRLCQLTDVIGNISDGVLGVVRNVWWPLVGLIVSWCLLSLGPCAVVCLHILTSARWPEVVFGQN